MMKSFLEYAVKLRTWIAGHLHEPALRAGSPALAALIFAAVTRRLSGRRRYRVLTVTKDFFEEDMRALSQFGDRIQYLVVGSGTLKRIFSVTTGGTSDKISWRSYFSPKYENARHAYYAFVVRMLPYLKLFLRLDAIMVCSFQYVSVYELARACAKHRLPFIVFHKEGMIVPERVDEMVGYLKKNTHLGPIPMDRMLVFNEAIRDTIIGLSVPGLRPEQIHATGAPRLDFYRVHTPTPPTRRTLVYFASEPSVDFYHFTEVWDSVVELWTPEATSPMIEALRARSREIYRAVVLFALKHPDVDVVVKIKRNSAAKSYVGQTTAAMLAEAGSSLASCPNLTITDDWIAEKLIYRATAIVSLNSTTGAEALLARKPVLTPDYGDFFPNKAWHYFHRFPELTALFRRVEDIERCFLGGFSPVADYEKSRNEFLKLFMATGASELSSAKVERNLIEVIESKGFAERLPMETAPA